MSYLNGLRLHFAGRFQAAPSTVNNDVAHYNNATFQPNFQEYGRGASNGWWNPGGGAEWRLLGCRVTSAWLDAATPAAATDIVLAGLVADTDRRAPAKIVDLDPLQQLVSFVWGMEVRICAASTSRPASWTSGTGP